MKEFMTLLENPNDIKGPVKLTLTIRDLEPGQQKYCGHNVEATVSPTPIEGADVLRMRHSNGLLLPAPWFIKIDKELGEYFMERPYSGIVD
ncbi:hypothetical protein ACFLWE_00680 [Chloroflexota bacterium]